MEEKTKTTIATIIMFLSLLAIPISLFTSLISTIEISREKYKKELPAKQEKTQKECFDKLNAFSNEKLIKYGPCKYFRESDKAILKCRAEYNEVCNPEHISIEKPN